MEGNFAELPFSFILAVLPIWGSLFFSVVLQNCRYISMCYNGYMEGREPYEVKDVHIQGIRHRG